mmetsp:Transcript_1344/g.3048  ORF Transcript_1344/g.3048 Transcript_1344/m.3048 type:complete len:168 (-) Transcript_1344:77-580(-)
MIDHVNQEVDTKWMKILDAGVKEFVPVKRYSISSLLELRGHANSHVKVDAQSIEDMVAAAFARRASTGSCGRTCSSGSCVSDKDKQISRTPSLADSASARSSSPTEAHVSEDEHHEDEDGWITVQKKVRPAKQPINTRICLSSKGANRNRNRGSHSNHSSHGKQRCR